MIKAACVSLAAFTPLNAAADGAEYMEIGYGKNRSVAYMQIENRGTGGSAIHLTDNTAAMYAGFRLLGVWGLLLAPLAVFLAAQTFSAPAI